MLYPSKYASFYTFNQKALFKMCAYLPLVSSLISHLTAVLQPLASFYIFLYVCWYSLPLNHFITLSHYHALWFISFGVLLEKEEREVCVLSLPSFNMTSVKFSNFFLALFLWSLPGRIPRDYSRNVFFWVNFLLWLFSTLRMNYVKELFTM